MMFVRVVLVASWFTVGCSGPEQGAGVATNFIALTGAQLGDTEDDALHVFVADHQQACDDPAESAWDYADECAKKWQFRVRVPSDHVSLGAQFSADADVDLTADPGSSTPPCVNLVFATIHGTLEVVALDESSIALAVAFDDLCWTAPPTPDGCRRFVDTYTATRCP